MIILVGIAFTGFLLVNLFTAERSPVVWQDEVALVDPAVNLVSGERLHVHGLVANR